MIEQLDRSHLPTVEEVLIEMEKSEMGSFFLMAQSHREGIERPIGIMPPISGPDHRCEDYSWLDGYCPCHLTKPLPDEILAALLDSGSQEARLSDQVRSALGPDDEVAELIPIEDEED